MAAVVVVAMPGAVAPGWAAVPVTTGAVAGRAALVVRQDQVAMAVALQSMPLTSICLMMLTCTADTVALAASVAREAQPATVPVDVAAWLAEMVVVAVLGDWRLAAPEVVAEAGAVR